MFDSVNKPDNLRRTPPEEQPKLNTTYLGLNTFTSLCEDREFSTGVFDLVLLADAVAVLHIIGMIFDVYIPKIICINAFY